MAYIDSRVLTKEMTAAYGRRCIRNGDSCTPNYFHLDYRLEADLICVDDALFVHEIEAKVTYRDFLQESYKSEKYRLMFDGLLDCNTFSYLVPENICERIAKETDNRFGIYCYYHENTKRKRVICKRKPRLLSRRMKSPEVFRNILKKTTLLVWS